mmetsp:Transcript_39274/g.91089  ORF Transcript_39274/g.91089 Transcript_39274/m.91089 type:complete len:293 (-) Transcript_39274:81-959(-)
MDKRPCRPSDDSSPEEKRLRQEQDTPSELEVLPAAEEESLAQVPEVDWSGLQLVEVEFYIEQNLIGWVIGTAGATVKSVEQAFQVAIAMDQATKSLGYSKLKIKGPAAMVQKAAEHINASLAVATASVHDGATEVPNVPTGTPRHRWRSRSASTAMSLLRVRCPCNGAGFSATVSGEPASVELKERISASLERMLSSPTSDNYYSTSVLGGSSVRVRIEQQWVGWIVGKGGAVVKEIETATGAKLSMNQETKALGYSVCTISGHSAAITAASHQVSDKLRQVNPNFQGLQPA